MREVRVANYVLGYCLVKASSEAGHCSLIKCGVWGWAYSVLCNQCEKLSLGVVLGNRLRSFVDGMFGKLPRKNESDGSLDFTSSKSLGLGSLAEVGGFLANSSEVVHDERVHDSHRPRGDADVAVDLLEDLVDVGHIFLGGSRAFDFLGSSSGCGGLLGDLLSDFLLSGHVACLMRLVQLDEGELVVADEEFELLFNDEKKLVMKNKRRRETASRPSQKK